MPYYSMHLAEKKISENKTTDTGDYKALCTTAHVRVDQSRVNVLLNRGAKNMTHVNALPRGEDKGQLQLELNSGKCQKYKKINNKRLRAVFIKKLVG